MKNLVLCFIMTICSSMSFAFDDKLVIFNTFEAPPFFSESKPEGGAVAYALKLQFKKMGYKLDFHFMPFARAKVQSKGDPQVVGYGPCSTFDLVKGFELSKSLLESKTLLIQRKDHPIEWKTNEDLKKFRVGQVTGYSLKGELGNVKLNVENTSDDVANLLKVANKHVDFAMIMGGQYEYLMATEPSLKPFQSVIEANPKPLAVVHWGAAFKKTPRARRIMEEFNSKVNVSEFQKDMVEYITKQKK